MWKVETSNTWQPIASLAHQCAWCKHKAMDRLHAACEHGQAWFPRAQKCAFYEPEDLDE